MRIKIPLTGKVLSYDPELAKHGGSSGIAGDLSDPVRPVPVNLGNVSWKLVSIDLENDLAEIEVSPSERIREDRVMRPATAAEKQGFLEHARNLVEGNTPDALYAMTGKKRLSKSAEVMAKYQGSRT